MNVLVVAAHPDDETLGAGGVIAKHASQGDSVSIIILGQGVTSRKEKNADSSKEITALRSDAKKAFSALGVSDATFADFPDNKFDSVALLDIVKVVEKKISEKPPEIIYTHHYGDLNIDHRRTFEAVLTACRPINSSVTKLLCFEVLSSTEWNAPVAQNAFLPNYFVDIGGFLDKKIAALKEYKTEMREEPHPRSLETVRVLAKLRGSVIGVNAAEAFEVVREIIK